MPRIRMKTLAAGPSGTMHPGKEYNVSKQQADDLVAGRYAELVGDPVSSISSDGPANKEKAADAKKTEEERKGGEDDKEDDSEGGEDDKEDDGEGGEDDKEDDGEGGGE